MKKKSGRLILVVICMIVLFSLDAVAQEEPLIEELRQHFKKDYCSLGLLLQVMGDGQIERSFAGRSGFNIANVRFILAGKLDNRFGYFSQVNFVNIVSILDAKIHYRISPILKIDLGLFKAPLSKEFLTPAESIDFVNRSQAATVLAAGRQMGLQLGGTIDNTLGLDYSLGIFNGNSFDGNQNDNENFMYAGRLSLSPFRNDNQTKKNLEIGVNGVFSKDASARVGELLNPFLFEPLFFSGKRTLWGGDARFNSGKFLLAAEYLKANFDGTLSLLASDNTINQVKPSGYHLTAGYMVAQKIQFLGRLDSFEGDNEWVNRDLIILGSNFWPTLATEF